MVTLMTWQSSGGEKRGCNGTCHKAKHARCVCICGGRYHGKAHQPSGLDQAVRDTWEEAVKEAEQKAEAEGAKLDTTRLRKFLGLTCGQEPPVETTPTQGTLCLPELANV